MSFSVTLEYSRLLYVTVSLLSDVDFRPVCEYIVCFFLSYCSIECVLSLRTRRTFAHVYPNKSWTANMHILATSLGCEPLHVHMHWPKHTSPACSGFVFLLLNIKMSIFLRFSLFEHSFFKLGKLKTVGPHGESVGMHGTLGARTWQTQSETDHFGLV